MHTSRSLSGLMLTAIALIVLGGCSMPGDQLDPQEGESTLVVATEGSGAGTVTSDPPGIDCGATCTAEFAEGTALTLTGQPDSGSVFSGWTGACSGAAATCELTMSGSHMAVAIFDSDDQTGGGPSEPPVDDGGDGGGDPPGDDSSDPDSGDVDPYAEQVTKQSGVRDGRFMNDFGASVDISGGYAIVSSPGEGSSSFGGGVFFFERDGQLWNEAAHADIPEEISAATTGRAVAISERFAAANYECFLEHPGCTGNGFLIFERSDGEWSRVARFDAEQRGPEFGWSLEFSNDYLFAGVTEDEFGQEGLVHVYQRVEDGWQLQQTLTQVDGDGDRFGNALASNDEYLAVGSDTGAHIYQLNADRWEYLQTVDVPSDDDFRDVAMNDRWLTSSWARANVYELRGGQWESAGEVYGPGQVALAGNYLLLGFPADSSQGDQAGSVRIFRWNGADWEQAHEIFASDPDPHEGFGAAVAATSDYAIVGADAGSAYDSIVGAAYFFHNSAGDGADPTGQSTAQ